VFRTSFPAQIEKGLKETRVLLRPVTPVDGTLPSAGMALLFQDLAPLALPTGVEIGAKSDKVAKGLEVFTETHVIAPVSGQIERMTGDHFDPGILREFIAEQSEQQGAGLGKRLLDWSRGVVFTIVGSTYQFVLILMLTAFIVIDRRRISEFFSSLPPPNRRAQYDLLMGYVDRGLAGVIRGQLLICLVNGVLTGIGLHLLGVPYATLLAFVAGVFSLIPVFGTIASSIPIVLVALATGGIMPGILALAWITFVHLLEANIFNPLIMGSSAEMHPVIIIFALLAGEHAFGVWGALLAVPAASLVQACFKYYRHEVLGMPQPADHGHGAWMRSLMEKFKGRKAAASGPGGPA
jgi:predicted PurR-regulated permease PerM